MKNTNSKFLRRIQYITYHYIPTYKISNPELLLFIHLFYNIQNVYNFRYSPNLYIYIRKKTI